ncbi:hypothetical protein KJ596_03595 [Patescibacteria group bacterium]|nr:hypothetical protein [Patescibacteria group bacterium]MBU1868589.1 hypothetical protein [Patescibacteria group bacterium]
MADVDNKGLQLKTLLSHVKTWVGVCVVISLLLFILGRFVDCNAVLSAMNMEVAEMVLSYLEVLLAWPVVCLILGIIFLSWFKKPISGFFSRMVKGELYGVGRLEASTPSAQRKGIRERPQETRPPQLQNLTEIEQYIQNNPKAVAQEFFRTLNSYWFERSFNIIYGTQIDLLEHLSTKGDVGEKYVNLVVFYNEFIKRSKLAATQMADYLGFMKDMAFIEYTGSDTDSSVRITPRGLNFLSYIKVQYPASYRYRPF